MRPAAKDPSVKDPDLRARLLKGPVMAKLRAAQGGLRKPGDPFVLPRLGTSPREAAAMYLAAGLEPIPLYEVTGEPDPTTGRLPCSCKDGAACGKDGRNAGKHPRGANWQTRPIDLTWWDRFPQAGIGLRMGGPERVVALDIDGDEGRAALRELEAKHGSLPPTTTQATGGGGEQRLFRVDDEHDLSLLTNQVKRVGPSLDVRATGGQVAVPPTRHNSGRQYEWTDRREPAPMPEWLFQVIAAAKAGGAQRPAPTGAPSPVVRPTPTRARSTSSKRPSAEERAGAWLTALPPAISGAGGHDATFNAALGLVKGFSLSESAALSLLRSEYNPRCQPAWSETELLHKIESAAKSPLPDGYLLNQDRPDFKRKQPVRTSSPASTLPGAAPANEQGGEAPEAANDADPSEAARAAAISVLAAHDIDGATLALERLDLHLLERQQSPAERERRVKACSEQTRKILQACPPFAPLEEQRKAVSKARIEIGRAELEKPVRTQWGFSDCMADLAPTPWVVADLWGPGRPNGINGYPNAGKTIVASGAVLALVTSLPLWECPHLVPARPCRALHVDFDQGAQATRKRYRRLAAGMGITLNTMNQARETLAGIRGVSPGTIGEMLEIDTDPNLRFLGDGTDPAAFVDFEAAWLRRVKGFDVVIIDSLVTLSPFVDEDKPRAAEVVQSLRRVSERTGATFVYLRHTSKGRGGDGNRPAVQAGRGSSAIDGATGSALLLEQEDPSHPIKATHVRTSQDAEGRRMVPFHLEFIDGEAVDGIKPVRLVYRKIEEAEAESKAKGGASFIDRRILEVVARATASGEIVKSANRVITLVRESGGGKSKQDMISAIKWLVTSGVLEGGEDKPYSVTDKGRALLVSGKRSTVAVDCAKCGGEGTIAKFSGRDGGKCYECKGDGKVFPPLDTSTFAAPPVLSTSAPAQPRGAPVVQDEETVPYDFN